MKKLLSILLVAVMLFTATSLVGCGKLKDVNTISLTNAKEYYEVNDSMTVDFTLTMKDNPSVNVEYKNINLVTGKNAPNGTKITGFDTKTAGVRVGTIEVGGCKATFEYVVYEKVTKVSNESGLQTALNNGGAIVIQNDINLTKTLEAGAPFTMYGQGYKITLPTSAEGVTVINFGSRDGVDKVPAHLKDGATVEIVNTIMEIQEGKTGSLKGLQFANCKNMTVKLSHTTIKIPTYYAISIYKGCDNMNLTIKNGSTSAGWCGIQSWSPNVTINIENSTLSGANKYPVGSNNFAAIVINTGSSHTENLAKFGSADNNTVNITNCTLIANTTNTAEQHVIDIRNTSSKVNFYGNNIIKLVKTTVENKTNEYFWSENQNQYYFDTDGTMVYKYSVGGVEKDPTDSADTISVWSNRT
ncbi:MAG: hypothetical protein RR207_06255 [Clostridia bacterium]